MKIKENQLVKALRKALVKGGYFLNAKEITIILKVMEKT